MVSVDLGRYPDTAAKHAVNETGGSRVHTCSNVHSGERADKLIIKLPSQVKESFQDPGSVSWAHPALRVDWIGDYLDWRGPDMPKIVCGAS